MQALKDRKKPKWVIDLICKTCRNHLNAWASKNTVGKLSLDFSKLEEEPSETETQTFEIELLTCGHLSFSEEVKYDISSL